MSTIRLGDRAIPREPGETVLAALERAGVRVASSCRAGACQACLLRASAGDPGAAAQQGLRPAQRARGCFLACVARPEGDLELADGDAEPTVPAAVVDVTPLAPEVVRVRLRPDGELSYRPGQYVQLVRGDGLVRAYSLAGLAAAGEDLELHVRVHPRGAMSRWLAGAAPGARVGVRGPAGECHYAEGPPDRPLLLAGTGTGLAPLQAIARDALARGHAGPIVLVHGARDPAGLYLAAALRDLAAARPNFTYVPCALSGEPGPDLEVGDLVDVALRRAPPLRGAGVYLCGSPGRVAALQRQCFLRGAALRDIHADAFLTAGRPA